jgi:hypothetical protein
VEYDQGVNRPAQRPIPALVAIFGTLLLLSSNLVAQLNSLSPTARSGSVAPPTGSVMPRTAGIAPPTGAATILNSSVTYNLNVPHIPHVPRSPEGAHNSGHQPPNHTANDVAYYSYVYALPVPYGVDFSGADNPNDPNGEDEEADYQGGPTIFDRRGSGPDSYIPPPADNSAQGQDGVEVAAARSLPEPEEESTQPPTTLVFKDGHQVEVGNYAIVSQTLYDLTPGHPRKIALADLDLPATQKQNDDHGVVFQLPPQPQGN